MAALKAEVKGKEAENEVKLEKKSPKAEPAAPPKTEIEVYFDGCQIIKKLGSASSPEKMQIVLEEQLL